VVILNRHGVQRRQLNERVRVTLRLMEIQTRIDRTIIPLKICKDQQALKIQLNEVRSAGMGTTTGIVVKVRNDGQLQPQIRALQYTVPNPAAAPTSRLLLHEPSSDLLWQIHQLDRKLHQGHDVVVPRRRPPTLPLEWMAQRTIRACCSDMASDSANK